MQSDHKPDVLPLVEEQVQVTKAEQVTGRVRVDTRTQVVESLIPVELSSVDVDVVRVPVDRKIDAVPEVVTQGDLTIIPVVEERIVVTRELYLREEVHVRRVERRENAEIAVTTRRQTVHVERLAHEGEDQLASHPITKDDQDDL